MLENQEKPGDFYSWLGNYIKHELKPKAIVIISAHWQGQGPNGVLGNAINNPVSYEDTNGDHLSRCFRET